MGENNALPPTVVVSDSQRLVEQWRIEGTRSWKKALGQRKEHEVYDRDKNIRKGWDRIFLFSFLSFFFFFSPILSRLWFLFLRPFHRSPSLAVTLIRLETNNGILRGVPGQFTCRVVLYPRPGCWPLATMLILRYVYPRLIHSDWCSGIPLARFSLPCGLLTLLISFCVML